VLERPGRTSARLRLEAAFTAQAGQAARPRTPVHAPSPGPRLGLGRYLPVV